MGRFFKATDEALAPTGTSFHCVLVGLNQFAWPVFGKDGNQEFGLKPVLSGLQAFGAANTSIGYDELVNGEPFGTRYLHENTVAIDRCRVYGIGNQVVQIMK